MLNVLAAIAETVVLGGLVFVYSMHIIRMVNDGIRDSKMLGYRSHVRKG